MNNTDTNLLLFEQWAPNVFATLQKQLACSVILIFNLYRVQESVVDVVEQQEEMCRLGKKFVLILVTVREACLR